MAKKLKIEIDEQQFEAATLDQAPKTVDSFLKYLPIDTNVYHCAWSGDSVFFMLPVDKVKTLAPENGSIYGSAGDMVWVAHPDAHELQMVHDVAQYRWKTGPMSCNVFARITSRLPEFDKLCRSIQREGGKKLKISLL